MVKLREVLFGFGQMKKNLTPLCDSFQCSWHFGGKAFKGDECLCCKDVKLMHLDKCLEWRSTNLKNYSSLTWGDYLGAPHVLVFSLWVVGHQNLGSSWKGVGLRQGSYTYLLHTQYRLFLGCRCRLVCTKYRMEFT